MYQHVLCGQALAAISHDLLSSVTRIKLRAEMAEASHENDTLLRDLDEIEDLLRQGLSFASGAQARYEKPGDVDIGSLVEGLVFDFQDAGRSVVLAESGRLIATTRAGGVRRILTNLIDNALKYGGSATICAERRLPSTISIEVLDRGPGIPEAELENAFKPFFRLECQHVRRMQGSGLGLAIADELTQVVGGQLKLRNRSGGGLSAQLLL